MDKAILVGIARIIAQLAQIRRRLGKSAHFEQIQKVQILQVLATGLVIEAPSELGQVWLPLDIAKGRRVAIDVGQVNVD